MASHVRLAVASVLVLAPQMVLLGCGSGSSSPKDSGSDTTGAGGDAGVTDGGGADQKVDAGPPGAPGNLAAQEMDRRQVSYQLTWTAPTGSPVTGYQIRYAKVPIDSANFDDNTVTTAVTYTNTPAQPGATDGQLVKNLYIETGYYFAVAAVNSNGVQSTIVSTTAASTSHFHVSTLAGSTTVTNEEFGYQLDTSGDVNKDGLSDLVVGVFNGQHAYLYLGTRTSFPTAPTVTFSVDAAATPVPSASFGRGVAIIGDIDNDGIDDIAISDRASPARVFIFKGRTTWPATLTHAMADYVISVDATYNNALFGGSIARLGDFNGDGVQDFAIGANLFGTAQNGRVVIILGKVGFPAALALPDAVNSIVIDADATLTNPNLGYRVLGLGHFYNATAGTTLVVSAPGGTAGQANSDGRLYAFHGQNATANGAIPIASADASVVGPGLRARLGTVLTNLGGLFGTLPSVGSGNPSDRSTTTPMGSAWVFNGTLTAGGGGPFASHIVITQATATNVGEALIGGGISGMDGSYSLIGGDTKPDVIQVPQTGTSFYIIDGRTLAGPPTPTSPVESATAGSVTLAYPANWTATGEAEGKLAADFDGDGYPDFVIANASGTVAGSVVAYW